MSTHTSFAELIDHHPGQSGAKLAAKALRQACAMMDADAGVLYLIRREQGEMRLVASAFEPSEPARILSIPLSGPGLSAAAARTGEAFYADAVETGAPPGFDASVDTPHGIPCSAIAAVPLTNHAGLTIGVVTLVRTQAFGRGFADAPRELFARFCRLAGAAVERADLLDRISRAPQHDSTHLHEEVETLARINVPEGMRGDDAFRLAISMLARAAEIYDEGSGNHVFRVNEYSHFLGRTLGQDEKYCHQLRYSAQLHDVGKMGVAPAVLRKTEALNPVERREMDNHTIYGHRILSHSPRLAMAAEIALNHHEKWDGSGYPAGKRGEDIPLSARIVQMADIYDALRSPRTYKRAFDHEHACKIILHGDERIAASGHFDPRIVEAFADTHARFAEIWDTLADT